MPIYFLIVCLITAQIGAMQPDEARKTTNDDGLGECSPDIALGYSGYAGEEDGRLPYLSSLSHSWGLVGWEVKTAEDGAAPNGELRVCLHRR
jgi:hypothetical protein